MNKNDRVGRGNARQRIALLRLWAQGLIEAELLRAVTARSKRILRHRARVSGTRAF